MPNAKKMRQGHPAKLMFQALVEVQVASSAPTATFAGPASC